MDAYTLTPKYPYSKPFRAGMDHRYDLGREPFAQLALFGQCR